MNDIPAHWEGKGRFIGRGLKLDFVKVILKLQDQGL